MTVFRSLIHVPGLPLESVSLYKLPSAVHAYARIPSPAHWLHLEFSSF